MKGFFFVVDNYSYCKARQFIDLKIHSKTELKQKHDSNQNANMGK